MMSAKNNEISWFYDMPNVFLKRWTYDCQFHDNNVCGLGKNCEKYAPSIACEMELKISMLNTIKLLYELWKIAGAN